MNKLIKIIICAVVIFANTNIFAQTDKDEISSALITIENSHFLKDLEFFSSDELKGRDTGSEGYAIAADYVANEFKSYKLLPFGDNNSYFQKVEMSWRQIDKPSVIFEVKNKSRTIMGKFGENISLLPNRNKFKVDTQQSLVFVGYGNIITQLGINDYENVDVKGKTVIAVLGGPKDLKHPEFNDIFQKIRNAELKGANGIILFYPDGKAFQNLIFKRIHDVLDRRAISLTDKSLKGSMLDIDMEIGVFAKLKFIKEIFEISGLNLNKQLKRIESGEILSKDLGVIINCSYTVKEEVFVCKNVAGILPGSDSDLKNEYIVVGAHLDHLGIGEPVKGDSVYNGMWDNASGSASVLSIARSFFLMKNKPKRSIIFVCYTGEEKGILGSNYFAEKYNSDKGKIVACINMDMTGTLFETLDIVPMGYTHSNLKDAVDYSADILGLKISDSKDAELDRIERSDQISFIKQGIPVLNISHGIIAADPKINAEKKTEKWMKERYHSPFDDMNQEFSEKDFITAVKLNFLCALFIANQEDEIVWNQNSWLYKKYVVT